MRTGRKGKERDLFICQACGSSYKSEGHYILEHYHGGAASRENIIMFCRNCHKKVHKGEMDLILF